MYLTGPDRHMSKLKRESLAVAGHLTVQDALRGLLLPWVPRP